MARRSLEDLLKVESIYRELQSKITEQTLPKAAEHKKLLTEEARLKKRLAWKKQFENRLRDSLAIGLCIRCSKPKDVKRILEEARLCADCTAKLAEYQRKKYASSVLIKLKTRMRRNTTYKDLRAAGLCCDCRKPAIENRCRCTDCTTKQKAKYSQIKHD